MGKAINEQIVKNSLKTLKENCGDENLISLRKAIFRNYGEIRELMEHGYTRDQIREQLQTDLGMKISKDTFCNYMMEAKQMLSDKLLSHSKNASLDNMPYKTPTKKVDNEKKQRRGITSFNEDNNEHVMSSDELKDKFNNFNNELDDQYEKYMETLENKG